MAGKEEFRGSIIPMCITLFSDANASAWTNMPAALTEFLAVAVHRTRLPLYNADRARLIARQTIAGSANAKLKVQYSMDESTWVDLCVVAVGASTGTKTGAWTDIPATVQQDIYLRLCGIDGDGVADPAFGLIVLQLK